MFHGQIGEVPDEMAHLIAGEVRLEKSLDRFRNYSPGPEQDANDASKPTGNERKPSGQKRQCQHVKVVR